jgi:aerobic carbon-monoxide dehydrogenase small subunit
MAMSAEEFTLNINGRDYLVAVEARKTLVDTVRDDCGLTGTHIGCEHGVCGACTILLDGEPVRSCLIFAIQASGRKIRTVEGLAELGEMNLLQRSFVEHHALQCGFCTPGFLMLSTAIVEQGRDLTNDELIDLLSSNLCRCTGYQNIIKAVRAVLDKAALERVQDNSSVPRKN